MRKIFSVVLAVLLLFSVSLADLPDISSMSYEELVQLKDQINLAIWNSQEWQEVHAPVGVWEVGIDIPAAKWVITLDPDITSTIYYVNKLNSSGTAPGYGYDYINGVSKVLSTKKNKHGEFMFPDTPPEIIIDMQDGWYFINEAPVTFTPYSGKPDLGFH